MNDRFQIYKCDLCGNVVEMTIAGKGVLFCCGKPMKLMAENTVDAAKEKHIPVVARTADGCKVAIGSVPHPMEDKHYIQWIEVMADGKSYREFLKPGAPPEASFCVNAQNVTVREYCNLHGLWKA
jgi:superoxide reductase